MAKEVGFDGNYSYMAFTDDARELFKARKSLEKLIEKNLLATCRYDFKSDWKSKQIMEMMQKVQATMVDCREAIETINAKMIKIEKGLKTSDFSKEIEDEKPISLFSCKFPEDQFMRKLHGGFEDNFFQDVYIKKGIRSSAQLSLKQKDVMNRIFHRITGHNFDEVQLVKEVPSDFELPE